MRTHLLIVVAAAPWLMAAAPAGLPKLDLRQTCSSRGTDLQQDTKACMQSEEGARQELTKSWGKVPAAIKETCLSEVRIGGSPSYVELLTCAQMNEWSSAGDAKTNAKAADTPRRKTP